MFPTAKILAVLIILILNFQLAVFNSVYAQDDFSDSNSQSVDSTNESSNTDQESQGGSYGITDINENPSGPQQDTGEAASIETGVSEVDSSGGVDTVSLGADVSNALISLGVAQEALANDPANPDLQQAVSDAQSRVDESRGAFDAYTSPAANEANSVESASQQLLDALSPEATRDIAPEDFPSYLSQQIDRATEDMSMDRASVVIGSAIKDPEVASEIAGDLAHSRGEGVATEMGSRQLAYEAAAEGQAPGADITSSAIAGTLGSLDLSDAGQTNTFINAAFSTAQTHGANPADVLSQLQSLGIDVGQYQEQIISAAVTHGISPDRVYSGATTPAGASTPQGVADTGPNAPAEPAPAPAPGTPTQVQPPEPQVPNPGNNSGSSCPGGVCP